MNPNQRRIKDGEAVELRPPPFPRISECYGSHKQCVKPTTLERKNVKPPPPHNVSVYAPDPNQPL